jgi:hypothetical protein
MDLITIIAAGVAALIDGVVTVVQNVTGKTLDPLAIVDKAKGYVEENLKRQAASRAANKAAQEAGLI